MARRFAALSALAVAALGACADPSAPTTLAPTVPSLAKGGNGNGVPDLASARSNKAEPKHLDQGRFNITLRYAPTVTEAQKAVFEEAAARWERIVIKDVPSITGTIPANFCGLPGVPAFGGTVDDLLIDVVLQPIDGPGKILGAAGPCLIRTVDFLPSYGIMFFDQADLAFLDSFGLFDETIVHEMGHVLGIGTLWNFGRTLRIGTNTADVAFIGDKAIKAYNSVGGDKVPVPVENTGGPGTRNGHWRESVFNNELMTGFLDLGENPLSRVSAGSLRDLGYGSSMAAEPYKLPVPIKNNASGADATAGKAGLNIADHEELISVQASVAEAP